MNRAAGRVASCFAAPLRRFPRPTAGGYGFLAAAAGAGLLALLFPLPAFRVLFAFLLAGILLSLYLGWRNLRRIAVARPPLPGVHAGAEFPVTLVLSREGKGADRCAIVAKDGVGGPFARPGHVFAARVGASPVVLRYLAKIRDRGRHEIRTVELSTRHPLGLFTHRVVRDLPGEVLVYPRLGRFRHEPLATARFSRRMTSSETARDRGEEEFRNLREYRRGDNPRLIAWKASARYAELMVREQNDDLAKRVTIFLESRLPPKPARRDRIRVERAIAFAATLVSDLARRHAVVTVHALSPEPFAASSGRGGRGVRRILERLALLEPAAGGPGLAALFAAAPPEAFLAALPVVIVPEGDDERLERLYRHLPSARRPTTFRIDGEWERALFHWPS